MGQVTGLHGLRGWLKVHSFTEPREQLLSYEALRFGDLGLLAFEGQHSGQRILLRPDGVDDRTAAEPLVGCELWLQRSELPPAQDDEYYWCDLEGCRVVNLGGDELGVVQRMLATGANDVMQVAGDRERLIPFVTGPVVKQVDLEQKLIRVDWETDY